MKATLVGGIAELILDQPEAGNSLGLKEAETIDKTLKDKHLRALILTGAGSRFFCTGGNLHEQSRAKTRAASLSDQKKIRAALERLSEAPVPTVALVGGDCFGGGTELLSAFDHVIAAPHVLFGFWQRKLGLTYGWGGGARLNRRLGGRLSSRALEARVFGSIEARDIGLVDQIVPAHRLQAAGRDWITRVLALPSFAEIKQWSEKEESKIFDRLWMNPTHQETVARHSKKP